MVVLQAKCPRYWIYALLPCQFSCGNPKRLGDRRSATSFPAPTLQSSVYPSHRHGNLGFGSGHGCLLPNAGDESTLPPQTKISHAGWPKGHRMVRRSTFNRDGESSILSSSTNDVVLPESSATSRDLRPLDSKPVQILPQSIGIISARLSAARSTE